MYNFGGSKMKKVWFGLLALGLLAGCSSKDPEAVTTSKQVKVDTTQQSDDQYIQVSIESTNKLTGTAAQLQTLLDNMNVEDAEWQSNVEDSINELSKAVNDYMMVEIKLSSEQAEKFKETKSYYSQGIASFNDIITDSRKALTTYDTKSLTHIRDMQLKQATNLIAKAKEQLEIERD